MQKKIIALAIAGLASTAAMAQSNVTVYGVVDMFYGHTTVGNVKSTNAVESGGLAGSRIGFKGTEDLGNGLSALFVLEYALSADDNSGVGAADTPWSGTMSRQSLVGLTSKDFGTIVAGRAQHLGYDWACAYTGPYAGGAFDVVGKIGGNTPVAGTTAYSAKGVTHGVIGCGSDGRADNAIQYITPTFGGFTGKLAHVRATENAGTTNTTDTTAWAASVSYANGPIDASAAYAIVNDTKGSTAPFALTPGNDSKEWAIGAGYNFGFAKVTAGYQTYERDGWSDRNSKWNIGATVPVGAKGVVGVVYAASNVKTANEADTKAWSLGYTHNLSKRTALYGVYTRFNNEANAYAAPGNAVTSTISSATASVGTGAGNGDQNASLLGLGVKHMF